MNSSHLIGALLFCAPLGLALAVTQSSSQGADNPPAPTINHALTAAVTPGAFCSFLPPQPGGNIADSESNAVVFCNRPSAQAPNANVFPPGFIKSAHFA